MMNWVEPIKPVKTSARTKAQIVVEKELELYPYLLGYKEPGTSQRHKEFCPCRECHAAVMAGIFHSMEKKGNQDVYDFSAPLATL